MVHALVIEPLALGMISRNFLFFGMIEASSDHRESEESVRRIYMYIETLPLLGRRLTFSLVVFPGQILVPLEGT